MGLLKKAVSGVLASFLCSRIIHTFRALNKGGPLRDAPSNGGLAERTFLNRPSGLVNGGMLGKYGFRYPHYSTVPE